MSGQRLSSCRVLAAVLVLAITGPALAQDVPLAPQTSPVPDAATVVIMGKKLRRDRKAVRIDTRSGSSCAFMRGYSAYDDEFVQDYLDSYTGSFDNAVDDPDADETDPLRPGARVRDNTPFGNAAQNNNGALTSPGDRFTSTRPGGCTQADVLAAAGRNEILRRDTSLKAAFEAFDSGDYTKALQLFEESYQKIGYENAAFMLAKMYLGGLGTDVNVETGVFWLKKVAEAKFDPRDPEAFDPLDPYAMSPRADATMTLAKIYLAGWGVQRNPAEAKRWYEKAESIGYVPAAHVLGQIYQAGFDGEKADIAKAIRFYQKAGEFGFTPSQYELGLIYYNGDGVNEDRKLAAQWLMAAASGGHPDALYEVGRMYDLGDTLPQDSNKALVYYKDAALKDQPEAQNALGTYFYSGEILAKDLSIARKWFEVAANNGEPDAMFNLAVMLMNGEGGDKDVMLAYVWFRLAQTVGLEKAKVAAAKLESQLSPEDRGKAEAILNPPTA